MGRAGALLATAQGVKNGPSRKAIPEHAYLHGGCLHPWTGHLDDQDPVEGVGLYAHPEIVDPLRKEARGRGRSSDRVPGRESVNLDPGNRGFCGQRGRRACDGQRRLRSKGEARQGEDGVSAARRGVGPPVQFPRWGIARLTPLNEAQCQLLGTDALVSASATARGEEVMLRRIRG